MRRPLAYAKDLAARRRNNERVALVVVSVHDWAAGKWFDGQPAVARLVVPDDLPLADADFSVALALDVLVCGMCQEPDFYAVCDALAEAGAASIWGEFDDGIWLVERVARTWVAVDGPYAVPKMSAVLRFNRLAMLIMRRGLYGSKFFDAARQEALAPFLEALKE